MMSNMCIPQQSSDQSELQAMTGEGLFVCKLPHPGSEQVITHFSNCDGLRVHQLMIHPTALHCKFCPFASYQHSRMLTHSKAHYPAKIKCELCKCFFSTPDFFAEHNLIFHTAMGEKLKF